MNILISNDDGIYAKGIKVLANHLREAGHFVYIIAPLEEQSGTSHGITLHHPLRVKKSYRKGEFFGYSVSGKPADTIKVALSSLYKNIDFDFIISGINHGGNLGTDIHYSGTFAAASEGALWGKRAIAISLFVDSLEPHFDTAGLFITKYLEEIKDIDFPKGSLLNINVPNIPMEEIKGIKYTKQSNRKFKENLIERTDSQGKTYYWLGGAPVLGDYVEDSDILAVNDGYISITPTKLDLYNGEFRELLTKK